MAKKILNKAAEAMILEGLRYAYDEHGREIFDQHVAEFNRLADLVKAERNN